MPSTLLSELLPLLRCPSCSSSLLQNPHGFSCGSCQREFPVIAGVARFASNCNYADSFGVQWRRFSRTQLSPEISDRNFRRKTGLNEEDLRGKLVLDVGCGMGRFAEVATRWGARVVGIDLSAAAVVAAQNLADREFVAFQADVFALPFKLEMFDCIYSVGVLHHTPDCEQAFKILPAYLKNGGSIAVWLYSGYNNWYRFSDIYREFTHRIPFRYLYPVFRMVVPLLYWLDRGLRVIPVIGRPVAGVLHHLFPVNRHPNPEIRLLDTLDWYSPKYQSKHTYEQVFRWFESCGLRDLTVGEASVSIKGKKPCPRSVFIEPTLQPQREASLPALDPAPKDSIAFPKKGFPARKKVARSMRWLPSYIAQTVARRKPSGPVHLIIAVANHFEPAIVPHNGSARAPYQEQLNRVEAWGREYPKAFDLWRDSDGCPFVHTYFYPAEQYDRGLIDRITDHCAAGWGEVEVHLHHGTVQPDTEENTRLQLAEFRDVLAAEHGCLSYLDGTGVPRFAFVHGNYALANSVDGHHCGVDSEMQVLADTGCYADFTLPPGLYHRAHISKINALYECNPPLNRQGAHKRGRDLEVGRSPQLLPLMIQGPLTIGFARPDGRATVRVENGSLTWNNPPTLYRLGRWKTAGIRVKGRPDWLFIKLQCHGMDPRDRDVMTGSAAQKFLRELVEGAGERSETVHFVTARQMVNIILAACDGKDGNPGEYRDYRLIRKRLKPEAQLTPSSLKSAVRA